VERIVIPAGTPEDQALQDISKESDAQKKLTMYRIPAEILGDPAAVAYGNWQVSQYYQTAGDLPKALEYGDKHSLALPTTSIFWFRRPASRRP